MIDFVLLFIAWFTDLIFANILGIAFVGTNISITSNLLFMTLILVTYNEDTFKSLLLALFTGLFIDAFNPNYMYLYAIIYVISTLIVRQWSMRINDTFIELLLTVLAAVFVKEFFLFMFYHFIVGYKITFLTFVVNHLAFTLLFNLLVSIILVIIKRHKMDKQKYEQQIKNRHRKFANRY